MFNQFTAALLLYREGETIMPKLRRIFACGDWLDNPISLTIFERLISSTVQHDIQNIKEVRLWLASIIYTLAHDKSSHRLGYRRQRTSE